MPKHNTETRSADFMRSGGRLPTGGASRLSPRPMSGPSVELWTDGSCFPNPGPGGWAFVITLGGTTYYEQSGSVAETTNNRMELEAPIQGLRFLLTRSLRSAGITVFSDSQYVVKGAMRWRHSWKKRDWRRKVKKVGLVDVKNVDLWQQLDALIDTTGATFRWVRGHSSVALNEYVDHLAVTARRATSATKPA